MASNQRSCRFHTELSLSFCLNHGIYCCPRCHSTSNVGCVIKTVEDAVEHFRIEAQTSRVMVKQTKQRCADMRKSFTELQGVIQIHHAESVDNVHTLCDHLRSVADRFESETILQVNQVSVARANSLGKYLDSMEIVSEFIGTLNRLLSVDGESSQTQQQEVTYHGSDLNTIRSELEQVRDGLSAVSQRLKNIECLPFDEFDSPVHIDKSIVTNFLDEMSQMCLDATQEPKTWQLKYKPTGILTGPQCRLGSEVMEPNKPLPISDSITQLGEMGVKPSSTRDALVSETTRQTAGCVLPNKLSIKVQCENMEEEHQVKYDMSEMPDAECEQVCSVQSHSTDSEETGGYRTACSESVSSHSTDSEEEDYYWSECTEASHALIDTNSETPAEVSDVRSSEKTTTLMDSMYGAHSPHIAHEGCPIYDNVTQSIFTKLGEVRYKGGDPAVCFEPSGAGNLLLATKENVLIKFDENGIELVRRKLSTWINDMCVRGTNIYATDSKCSVHVLDVNTLISVSTFNGIGVCSGINSFNEYFVVTRPVGDHKGVYLVEINNMALTVRLKSSYAFNCPMFVTSSASLHNIAVSDTYNNSIIILSSTLCLIRTLKLKTNMLRPHGICIVNESVIIACHKSQSVVECSINGVYARTILSSEDIVGSPRMILYHSESRRLVVSYSANPKSIFVFRKTECDLKETSSLGLFERKHNLSNPCGSEIQSKDAAWYGDTSKEETVINKRSCKSAKSQPIIDTQSATACKSIKSQPMSYGQSATTGKSTQSQSMSDEHSVTTGKSTKSQPMSDEHSVTTGKSTQSQTMIDEHSVTTCKSTKIQPMIDTQSATTCKSTKIQPPMSDGQSATTYKSTTIQPMSDGQSATTCKSAKSQPMIDGQSATTCKSTKSQPMSDGQCDTTCKSTTIQQMIDGQSATTCKSIQSQPMIDGQSATPCKSTQSQPMSDGQSATTCKSTPSQPMSDEHSVITCKSTKIQQMSDDQSATTGKSTKSQPLSDQHSVTKGKSTNIKPMVDDQSATTCKSTKSQQMSDEHSVTTGKSTKIQPMSDGHSVTTGKSTKSLPMIDDQSATTCKSTKSQPMSDGHSITTGKSTKSQPTSDAHTVTTCKSTKSQPVIDGQSATTCKSTKIQPTSDAHTVTTCKSTESQPTSDAHTVTTCKSTESQPVIDGQSGTTCKSTKIQQTSDAHTVTTCKSTESQPVIDGQSATTCKSTTSQPTSDAHTVTTYKSTKSQPVIDGQSGTTCKSTKSQPKSDAHTVTTCKSTKIQPVIDGQSGITCKSTKSQPKSDAHTATTCKSTKSQPMSDNKSAAIYNKLFEFPFTGFDPVARYIQSSPAFIVLTTNQPNMIMKLCESGVEVSSKKTAACVNDLCIRDAEIYTSGHDGNIRVYSIRNLSLLRTIYFDFEEITGICTIGQGLAILHKSKGVWRFSRISINGEARGSLLSRTFKHPLFVGLIPVKHALSFVTDASDNCIVAVQGNLADFCRTISHPLLQRPAGVCTDGVYVYVACQESSAVLEFHSDGRFGRILLTADHGIDTPRTIAYHQDSGHFVVSSTADPKKIIVFARDG